MTHLSEVRDRLATLPSLENRSSLLQKSIHESEEELASLLQTLVSEERDIERLKKESLSVFLLKAFGRYEDRIDKENRKEVEAKLSYDKAKSHLDALKQESENLCSRISELRREACAFEDELEERRKKMWGSTSSPKGLRFKELDASRQDMILQMTEIKAALRATYRVKTSAQSALDSLESAENWATFDVLSQGGVITHIAKYSYIDDAQDTFHHLTAQLKVLQSELADVHNIAVPQFSEISSTQRAIDFWFDNVFTDLSVRDRIQDNAFEIYRLIDRIKAIERVLNTQLGDFEAKLTENSHAIEDLLISLENFSE